MEGKLTIIMSKCLLLGYTVVVNKYYENKDGTIETLHITTEKSSTVKVSYNRGRTAIVVDNNNTKSEYHLPSTIHKKESTVLKSITFKLFEK